MNAVIDLGNGDSLQLEPARRVLRLYPGAGGAQVEVTLRISKAQDLAPGVPYRVSAQMYVEDIMRRQRMLCVLNAASLVTPLVQAGQVQMSGFVTDEQLRAVEQLRAGGDLWVNLKLSVSSVERQADSVHPDKQGPQVSLEDVAALRDGKPTELTWLRKALGAEYGRLVLNAKVTFERPLHSQRTGDLRFDINAGEWASQVAAVDAGAFVELLVPLARGADYTGAVAALRAARELLRQGNIEPAIVEARKAVEQVRDAYGTLKLFNAAKTKAPRQRTYDERWAFMVEDLFSTMSGAGHKDEVTQDFEYTREDAEMLIVATAGMLKRLSLDSNSL
ncbi:hypothetical protein ACLQ29_31815 [Micromonospora sp. DT228]|uniref:hypothetical protein n=1 Tax=Micromonospora sp. DT228 TaxID=3393443 RepID=UPI003CF95448